MKKTIAQKIVDKANHPLLKVLKVREDDYEGIGVYEIGLETKYGILYWGRNTNNQVGSPRVKNGFRLIAKIPLLNETFNLLEDIMGNKLDLSRFQWDGGDNTDFIKEVSGIPEFKQLGSDFEVKENLNEIEIASKLILEYFIPKCQNYLTYCDLYNNYYEPFAKVTYKFEEHESFDCSAVTGTAEHYRLILKAIIKSPDFEVFKAILFEHYNVDQRKVLAPYFKVLDDIYRDNSYTQCNHVIEPNLSYIEIENYIRAHIKAEKVNLERIHDFWIPNSIEKRKNYDPTKTFPDQYYEDYYKAENIAALEVMYLCRVIPNLLRTKKWQNALDYVENDQFSIETLFQILEADADPNYLQSCIDEAKKMPSVDAEMLEKYLNTPPYNEFSQKVINDWSKESIKYQHQLRMNHEELMNKNENG